MSEAKEAIYDERIAPLIKTIIAECKGAGIPLFASFLLDGDLAVTTYIVPPRNAWPLDDAEHMDDFASHFDPLARNILLRGNPQRKRSRQMAYEESMQFDPFQLGYTRKGRALFVHYPHRDEAGDTAWGAGMEFDPQPEMRLDPDGARAKLWREMLSVIPKENATHE